MGTSAAHVELSGIVKYILDQTGAFEKITDVAGKYGLTVNLGIQISDPNKPEGAEVENEQVAENESSAS